MNGKTGINSTNIRGHIRDYYQDNVKTKIMNKNSPWNHLQSDQHIAFGMTSGISGMFVCYFGVAQIVTLSVMSLFGLFAFIIGMVLLIAGKKSIDNS